MLSARLIGSRSDRMSFTQGSICSGRAAVSGGGVRSSRSRGGSGGMSTVAPPAVLRGSAPRRKHWRQQSGARGVWVWEPAAAAATVAAGKQQQQQHHLSNALRDAQPLAGIVGRPLLGRAVQVVAQRALQVQRLWHAKGSERGAGGRDTDEGKVMRGYGAKTVVDSAWDAVVPRHHHHRHTQARTHAPRGRSGSACRRGRRWAGGCSRR